MTNCPRIKMCGMTRSEDVAQAYQLGVHAIGLIFYEKSPRAISVEKAQDVLMNGPFVLMHVVGVFVNPDVKLIDTVLSSVPIDYLQFHGDESPEFCEQFEFPYIKGIRAQSPAQIVSDMERYAFADGILLDTPTDAGYGGSGKTFDWKMLPEQPSQKMILAGGLTAENLAKVPAHASIAGLDVCSGVETAPGVKDHQKMTQFLKAVQTW